MNADSTDLNLLAIMHNVSTINEIKTEIGILISQYFPVYVDLFRQTKDVISLLHIFFFAKSLHIYRNHLIYKENLEKGYTHQAEG